MKRGIACSVIASSLFGLIYYWVTLMHPLTAPDIFAWRMSMTGPMVSVLFLMSRQWAVVPATFRDIGRRPGVILIHLANAANVGGQQYVFMWAPLHGRALEASLGYFLMPLVMVVIGQIFYREQMSRFQIAASVLAALGVGHEIWRVGTIGWVVPFIAVGFPMLFVLRRAFRTAGQGGAWLELNLVFLIAFGMLVQRGFTAGIMSAHIGALLAGLGLISAISMMAYYASSRALPFSLFGLLGYLEPLLLLVVALILGESLGHGELLTYAPIWLAVTLLVIEGITSARRRHSHRFSLAPALASRVHRSSGGLPALSRGSRPRAMRRPPGSR